MKTNVSFAMMAFGVVGFVGAIVCASPLVFGVSLLGVVLGALTLA